MWAPAGNVVSAHVSLDDGVAADLPTLAELESIIIGDESTIAQTYKHHSRKCNEI